MNDKTRTFATGVFLLRLDVDKAALVQVAGVVVVHGEQEGVGVLSCSVPSKCDSPPRVCTASTPPLWLWPWPPRQRLRHHLRRRRFRVLRVRASPAPSIYKLSTF